jgi:hypothetical protein
MNKYLSDGFMVLIVVFYANICQAPENVQSIELPETINISRASIYQAVPAQTNRDNLTTASGFKLDSSYVHSKHRILAVSRDLMNHLSFGDAVLVRGTGEYDGVWYVHDLMNKRYVSAIDFLTDIGTPNTLFSDVTITKLNIAENENR